MKLRGDRIGATDVAILLSGGEVLMLDVSVQRDLGALQQTVDAIAE